MTVTVVTGDATPHPDLERAPGLTVTGIGPRPAEPAVVVVQQPQPVVVPVVVETEAEPAPAGPVSTVTPS